MRLVGYQAGVEDGEVDLLLFRKVDRDDCRETIEDAAQSLLLGRAHACANQVRPQRPQFLGEPTDLDMVTPFATDQCEGAVLCVRLVGVGSA